MSQHPTIANPVDSEAFRRWFAGSGVRDGDRPRLLFHGTSCAFSRFSRTKDIGFHFGSKETANEILDITVRRRALRDLGEGDWGFMDCSENNLPGIHSGEVEVCTSDGVFDRVNLTEVAGGERILPVYLHVKNPLRVDDLHLWSMHSVVSELIRLKIIPRRTKPAAGVSGKNQVRDWLAAKGFDGIVYANEFEDGGDSYIVFDSRQVKSAFGNSGRFQAKRANIFD